MHCVNLNLEIHKYDYATREMFYCEYDQGYHYSGDSACSHFTTGSSCYLTSACVGYLGKPDDCHELTVLREFRDNYLKKTEEGSALVKQYYEVAPKIVEQIDASDKQKEYYEYIYNVVSECVACLEKEDHQGPLSRYREMTLKLQAELLEK